MNENGNPATLQASHPDNTSALKHGIYSRDGRSLEPRAREIAERVLSAAHVTELDEIGAVEIGRLNAWIEVPPEAGFGRRASK